MKTFTFDEKTLRNLLCGMVQFGLGYALRELPGYSEYLDGHKEPVGASQLLDTYVPGLDPEVKEIAVHLIESAAIDRTDYDYIMACKMVVAKRNYFLTGDVQPVYEVLAELHREY